MTRTRVLTLAVLLIALTGCATIREQLIRNNYLSTGRAPEGWVPKKSLCPAFARNGWYDHPTGPLCWAPPSKVGSAPKNTTTPTKKP